MFLFEMAFTPALVTSFSKPPIWDERKTCTWGPQGWLRRCLSSVTLEQRSNAIYLYLYALSLYSICTYVCLGSDVSRSSSFEKLSVFGERKKREGVRRKKSLSLCLCSLTLSLSWPPLPYSSSSSYSSPSSLKNSLLMLLCLLVGLRPSGYPASGPSIRLAGSICGLLFGHHSVIVWPMCSHCPANLRLHLAVVRPLLFGRCSASPIWLLLGRSSANNRWMSLSSDCRTIWPALSSDEALRLWHPPLELQHLNQYSQLQLHAEAAFSLE